jgi:hypothetical protein
VLSLERLHQVLLGDEVAAHQDVAERLARRVGGGVDDLAVLEDEQALAVPPRQHQLAGLAADRQHLQDLGERQVLETTDETHRSGPPGRSRNSRRVSVTSPRSRESGPACARLTQL